MSTPADAARTVRDIIDANLYLVLATADADGRPWSSPVYFAHRDCTTFYWVSSPDVTHSRNIAVRPQVGFVVFDSQARISTGQGVYMSGTAKLVEGDEVATGIETFSRRSLSHGGHEWGPADVAPDGDIRLYRVTVDGHWILAKDGRPDHRIAVHLG